MKYIIAILVVVTIMHDISLWRLHHKVEVLIAFFNKTVHILEDYTSNCSEKPNNCEECKHWNDTEDGCADRHGCRATTEDCSTVKPQNYCDDCLYCDTCDSKEFFYACTSKATISKMEQVETMSCAECKHRPIGAEICEEPCHYEPQTDWHYDEQDATWYPYKHKDEPQTEETEMERLERIDNELEDAWARIRELTDEPQK